MGLASLAESLRVQVVDVQLDDSSGTKADVTNETVDGRVVASR